MTSPQADLADLADQPPICPMPRSAIGPPQTRHLGRMHSP
jgi:hypothetical protein